MMKPISLLPAALALLTAALPASAAELPQSAELQYSGSYGIPKDTMFGFPVTCENGEYKLVEGLEIDDFSRERIDATLKELEEEKAGIAHLL